LFLFILINFISPASAKAEIRDVRTERVTRRVKIYPFHALACNVVRKNVTLCIFKLSPSKIKVGLRRKTFPPLCGKFIQNTVR